MTDIERAVQLTGRELGVIQGLAVSNGAETVTIREQQIAQSDAWRGFREQSGQRRAYVVTIVKPNDAEDTSPFAGVLPESVQLLVISGPGIDGPVDVVALSPIHAEEKVPA